MFTMSERAFLPPRDGKFYLLRQHRQPLAANLAAAWIEEFTAPGDLVIDPFVASDAVVRAAVERGRRILASDSNPLVAWATRVEATLPGSRELHAALVRLGDTPKEGEPLREYLVKLYASQCGSCAGAVSVDYFINRRDGDKMLVAEKVFTCASCGTRREDATETDRQRAADAAPHGLSYHLLVQRLIADDPANTPRLKRLLELYTPRNLAALAAVTQKLDAEFREDAARNLLAALLLHALDVGSSLYPEVNGLPARDVPFEFVEMNIWRALETAERGLGDRGAALRLVNPAQVLAAQSAAAFVGVGGARFLAEQAKNAVETNARAALILASPARLDPLFWELSFLWTRWLLGKSAAAALEPLFGEERQRWGWYGRALANAYADVARLAHDGAPFAASFPAGSHAMIEALMLAAAPHFALDALAFQPTHGMEHATEFGAVRGEYQIVWRRAENQPAPAAASQLVNQVHNDTLIAAREILEKRGEPLVYSWLHHAALDRLARSGTLAALMQAKYREGDNPFQFLRHRMEEGFKRGYVEDFDHWRDQDRVLWLRRSDEQGSALAERVERAVAQTIGAAGSIGSDELEDAILRQFSNLLTPERGLIEICARAYATWTNDAWVWQADDPGAQLSHAPALLAQLGTRLGYQVNQDAAPFELVWRAGKVIPASSSGSVAETIVYENACAFLVRARADFSELVARRAAPLRGLVVIPERQVELTRERLRRDPRWRKRLERAGWDFLRVPFVEMLLEQNATERPELELAIGLDPPLARGREQMELFK